MTVENTMTAGPTLRDKFLEDLANTRIIWDTAEKVAYKKGYSDGYKDGLGNSKIINKLELINNKLFRFGEDRAKKLVEALISDLKEKR